MAGLGVVPEASSFAGEGLLKSSALDLWEAVGWAGRLGTGSGAGGSAGGREGREFGSRSWNWMVPTDRGCAS